MSTGTRRWAVLAATAAMIATACGGGDTASNGGDDAGAFTAPEEGVYADRIDYGLIYDQTGPTAGTQTLFAHGIISHIQAVNEAGGVNGRTINLLEEDEKYEVPAGVAAYNKLVDQTPVVGPPSTTEASRER